ncbi:FkbM family methyltransferase [Natronorubrum sp. JWXQ-INN-674]|uniref:FkbM family methyltransferase n=1 Tax=Natronorubrum halalkaliphilum TaxID=2691917 RepID=A0A6B0VIR3_9EURY|nr:FkbM family methyltransferase [Natronorubrum halalkaliphilum]MXV60955.1 FkbM family methyltransferase [Natronorubrum halalkaliphilum]
MEQKIRRFVEIQHNHGTISALNSTKSYLKNKYWNVKGGTQTLTIGNLSAEFDATTDRGGDKIRWMCNAEERFLKDISNELKDDDVFFDIGANLGVFSCFASQVVSRGHIVAFEPYPPNYRQLNRNLSYNAPSSSYDVFDIALSNSQGSIEFSSPSNDTGNQTANISPTGDSIEVQEIPGDQLVTDRSVPSPTVVKIDVEGSEPLVIDGLEESLNHSSCRILYCEIHLPKKSGSRPSVEYYGESQKSMLEKISKLGFDITYSEKRDREVHVKAEK